MIIPFGCARNVSPPQRDTMHASNSYEKCDQRRETGDQGALELTVVALPLGADLSAKL